MCGLTGVFAFTEEGEKALGSLGAASERLRHRGPNADGIFRAAGIGLAHRRLSVIAPTAAGNQPMTDATGRYTIVYNGEIFNYKELRQKLQNKGLSFKTDSDTEVLLQLYSREGEQCLKKLHGFFVFAIYDAADQSLFIARDRFGEKPLLYYKDADKFLFGSELGALFELGVPRAVDFTSLYQYLQLTYVPAPASMVKGVKKLLPGHTLLVKGQKVQVRAWYTLPFDPEKIAHSHLTYKQQQGRLVQLMEQAVAERLVADVPVGAFLSGGIDSSVVVALASKLVPDLQTFSVGYKGNSFFDETAYARLVADRYKTNHTEYLLTTSDLFEHLEGMLQVQSEPFADSSALAVYTLSGHVSKRVKAVLSGDGADELFGGYNKHKAEFKVIQGDAMAGAVSSLKPLWDMLPKSRNSFWANKVRQLQRFATGAKLSASERYWYWATWQTEKDALKLLDDAFTQEADNRLYHARKKRLTECINGNLYSINNVLCADWHLVLANDMLPKIDLMGMAHGLEIRSPFLDHRVVKFAFSLPGSAKIDKTLQKKIIQESFRHLLPAALYNRPKQGFEIPLLPFLKTEAQSLINHYLSESFVQAQGIFNVQQVRHLTSVMGTAAAGSVQTRIWTLLIFQHWWDKWMQTS